jgi:hypothetical protein
MKIQEVIKPENDGLHKRTLGRYWASDLSSIIGGYLTAPHFFEDKEINDEGSTNIFFGVALENELTKRFEKKKIKILSQTKYELKIAEGIILVVKPDFETTTYGIECKCPKASVEEIPVRYKYQLEAEARAAGKPMWLLSFQKPEIVMFPYQSSDETWEKVKVALIDFHRKLLKLNKKQNVIT